MAVVGPTAVGKTDLSLDLAVQLDAEVVNADSMQLYRGMDIGTAKVPAALRRGVPHHLLDVMDVRERASAARYQREARQVIDDIHSRGRAAILVGGSGLFISAVLDDLRFPAQDLTVRARLMQEAQEIGTAALHARLMAHDATAAARILPSNTRRVVRALEVLEITGALPVTHLGPIPERMPCVRIGLHRERPELDDRVERRVSQMWQDGLVAEVSNLVTVGLREGVTARKALGYQQVLSALAGDCDLQAARTDTVTATRRYVRRQESWFRRDPRVQWLPAADPQLTQRALTAIRQRLDSR